MNQPAVMAALARVIDPELRAPITELGMVGEIDLSTQPARVQIKLTIVGCPAAQKIESDVKRELTAVLADFEVQMDVMSAAEREALKSRLRGSTPVRSNPFAEASNLTRVIFVGSGKGGVGKSTITANLAVALAQLGEKVGLIDADIFGYSIPGQLGITTGPTNMDGLMLPPIAFDVRVISIGMFVTDNQPVGWRGPMLHRAVERFLTDVYWGDLDTLLVDLPPGTGDVAISMGQLLPTAQSIVVTTPQESAATVAERSGVIGFKTGGAVLGVIENMSYLEIGGERHEIFGSGGGESVAERLSAIVGESVPLLAQLPLDTEVRIGSDRGEPAVLSFPDSAFGKALNGLAEHIHRLPRGLSGKKLGLNPS